MVVRKSISRLELPLFPFFYANVLDVGNCQMIVIAHGWLMLSNLATQGHRLFSIGKKFSAGITYEEEVPIASSRKLSTTA